METLFWNIVNMITEWITGVESGYTFVDQGELIEYFVVRTNVITWTNIGIAALIAVSIVVIVKTIKNKVAHKDN